MQTATESSSSSAKINLFDILKIYSNARDIFHVATALQGEQLQSHPTVQNLEQSLKAIVKEIVINFHDVFRTKAIATVQLVSNEGIGDVMLSVHQHITDISTWKNKFLSKLGSRNFLVEIYLGHQLFKVFLDTHRQKIIDSIGQLKDVRQHKQLSEIQLAAIEQALVTLASNHDFVYLTLPEHDVKTHLTIINECIRQLVTEFGLEDVRTSFYAFDEIVKVNNTVARYQLTEMEVGDLTDKFAQYLKNEKKDSPDIFRMMSNLSKIKPILVLDTELTVVLLDKIFAKAKFIKQNFDKETCQVYKTYEGLGLVTTAYAEAITALDSLSATLMAEDPTSSEMIKIEKYKEAITNYYQLTMRFDMPLKEYLSAYQKIQAHLQQKQEGVSLFVPSAQRDIQEADVSLQQAITGLAQCSELLRQKSLTVNALKDIAIYIQSIKAYLATPVPPQPSRSFFFGPSTVQNYRPILRDILLHFSEITHPRKESFTNFVAIYQRIKDLRKSHNITLYEKPPEECVAGEDLLLNIYKRFRVLSATQAIPVITPENRVVSATSNSSG